jgi:hypothetical protein
MTEDLFKHDTDGDRNISYQECGASPCHVPPHVVKPCATRYLDIVSSSDMLASPGITGAEAAAPPPAEKKKPARAGDYCCSA